MDFANFNFFCKLWTAVYPSNMAPIRLKLCQNAFQTIPDISFFDAETQKTIFGLQTLKIRLPLEYGSVWPETLGKRVSDDAWHFILRRQKKMFDKNFGTPHPRKSAKCLFWRSCEFLDVNGRSASKIHCQTYRLQPPTTLGGGVKKAVSVFFITFGRKNLYPLRLN